MAHSDALCLAHLTAPISLNTLSLHDALPISMRAESDRCRILLLAGTAREHGADLVHRDGAAERLALRSEEHTSELQSLTNLVCRLLLEKKKPRENFQSREGNRRIRENPFHQQ